jgi:phosphohistidine swiveling domain-containing protein
MLHDAYDLSFYEFDDDKDLKEYGVLLCDVVHGRPPMKPAYMGIGWYWYYSAIRKAADDLHLPTTFGWDSRFVQGYPYITAIRTSPEEAKAREPVFRERIRPFLENFDGVWDPLKAELLKVYKEAKESRGLKEWSDIQKLSNSELLTFLLDFVYVINRREADVHFYMLMASFYIVGLLQEMWRTIFGEEPSIDPNFHKVMSGFENQDMKLGRMMWQLGRKAVELGLEETFKATDDDVLIEKLNTTEAGRTWNSLYHEFLLEHGWRSDRAHSYDSPVWIEKPNMAISRIKLLMGAPLFKFDVERERVIKEREQTEKEVLAKVPEAQRPAFGLLVKAAQKSGYWSEDHGYYCDCYVGAIGRWILQEFGRRFAQAGTIDDAEDIYFLHPNEVRKAAVPMGRINLRPYVERRKKVWEENMKIEPAPFFGDISQAQDVVRSDPTLLVSTQVPVVRKELKADLYGASSAPGSFQGIARVIMTVDKISELKPGEILVAPGTSTAWMVVFGIIKGLVTDGGGVLSHPVIMAREFGIPCVSGTVEATQKIKTGDKIWVDGNRGIVYIMDK